MFRQSISIARVLPVVALVVPASILILMGWLNWRAVWADARADMWRASLSIAEYANQSLESYSVAADRLNDRLRGLSDEDIRADERALHDELRAREGELSRMTLSYVLDRDGIPILASSEFPVPQVSLADRGYFQALSAENPPDVYVSSTFIGRFDDRLLFAVARPRHSTGNEVAPDGFDGVALVSVDPSLLSDGMHRLLASPADKMVLVRDDGATLATTGAIEPGQTLPQIEPDSDFGRLAAEEVTGGIFESATDFLGSPALIAMQKVDRFPIYAVSLRPRSAIVAAWWGVMWPHLLFGIPATLGLMALGLKVLADQRKLGISNQRLAAANDLSTDRLSRSMRFGLVGTFEFDLATGESRRSPEYMAIHGLPPVPTVESHHDWEQRVHPDDRNEALEQLKWALSDESGATDYGQSYRIVTSTGDIRWIAARGVITRDAAGKATMLLGAHVDVTPLQSSQMALAKSDARLRLAQDAIGIGTWEWTAETGTLKCSSRMLELFGLDPDVREPRLADLLRRVDPADRDLLRSQIRKVTPGQPLTAEFRLVRPTSADTAETVWISVRAASVALTDKDERRVIGIAYDISGRKRDEEMVRMMAQEVEHRARNSLALISGLLRLTKANSAAQLVKVMDGRIQALSKTLGLLRKSRWNGADLEDLIGEAVAPFVDMSGPESGRVAIVGEPVKLSVSVAQPLSMVFHELATNASKYGSLSREEGRLKISWTTEEGRILIVWKEEGVHGLPTQPEHTGFGSQLISILFEGQLGGKVRREWTETGLVCHLSLPTTSVAGQELAKVA